MPIKIRKDDNSKNDTVSFVFLEPLPPGKHDLYLSVSVANHINPQYNYAADWTYHLIVK
jgi:hypothetical protein